MTSTPKRSIDWELIEKEFRAGLKTVREIGREQGVSHTAIQKRADKFGWTRDLAEKIQQAAQDKVSRELVADALPAKTDAQRLSDAQVVAGMKEKVADVDLTSRGDLEATINVQRGLLEELAALSRPEFAERLEWLGQVMDESGPNANGTWVKDKVNELYQYIISLSGRVKMAKDIASAYGVYIPLQRKVWGLDREQDKTSEVDELLKRINQGRSGA